MRYRVEDGEKGPMAWEAESIPIYPENEDGLRRQICLVAAARNVLAPDEVTYVASNAPLGTPVPTLVLVAFSRWRVARCSAGEKGELGPDHFEGRKHQGLKRHLIPTAVSHLFRAKARRERRGKIRS